MVGVTGYVKRGNIFSRLDFCFLNLLSARFRAAFRLLLMTQTQQNKNGAR